MKTIKISSYGEIPDNFTGIVEWADGTKFWFKEGERHRLDGPAREWANGYKEWWVDGKQVTKLEHDLLTSILKLKGLL